MTEIWKDIKNYEGLYQVSNLGNVRGLRFINNIVNKEKIHGISITTQNSGYLKVMLYKDGKPKNVMVHRLVAEAFIDNPENKKQINHKDGNKHNNCVTNLEWCSKSENMRHAFKMGLATAQAKGKFGSENPKAISVNMIDKETGNIIKKFNSIIDATHYLGKSCSGHICNCCKGKLKSAYGYKWEYADE